MRLLDRYLLRELLTPMAFCLGGFFIFFISFDLITHLESFQRRRLGFGDIVGYYWYELPNLLTTVMPVGFLLGLLYALTRHARHHELTAIRGAGVSLWRICLPYWLTGLVLSGVLYGINEHWAGEARERQQLILDRHSVAAGEEEVGAWRSLDFQNRTDRHSWSIGGFHLVTAELRSPRIRLPLGRGAHHVHEVNGLRWTNGRWRPVVLEGEPAQETIHRYSGDPEPAQGMVRVAEFPNPPFTPDDVIRWEHRPLPVPELRPLWLTNEIVGIEGAIEFEVILTNEVVEVSWHTNLVLPRHLTDRTSPEGAWHATVYDPERMELYGVTRSRPLPGDAQRLVIASEGHWVRGEWEFRDVQDYIYRHRLDNDPMATRFTSRRFPELSETPAMLRSEARVGGLHRGRVIRKPHLTAQEVRDYYHLHQDVPPELAIWLDTQLYSRLAAPWTCLVVALIAIPFGAAGGRKNVFYGVAGSIGIGFLYFILQRVGFAMGQGGKLAPVLAAWLPNGVFGLLGLILTARVR